LDCLPEGIVTHLSTAELINYNFKKDVNWKKVFISKKKKTTKKQNKKRKEKNSSRFSVF